MEAAEVAAVVGKVAERLEAEDYDDDHEGITEESVAKVMSWLELEIKLARTAAAGAAFAALPPQPAAMAAGYVTVSGNEESCGSSLSGPASTVMASVDGRAGARAAASPAVPWPWPEAPAAEEEEDDDDEWVSQLLTDGPEGEGQPVAARAE
ncbi:hypothetical protein ACP70R_031872 [Stipagrostis hirtigluma subsp. patula]